MVTWRYAKNRTSFHRRDLLPRFEPRQRTAGSVSRGRRPRSACAWNSRCDPADAHEPKQKSRMSPFLLSLFLSIRGKSLEPYEGFLHPYSCNKVLDGKGDRKMATQERFQAESIGSDEILHVESDEEGCVNYDPGMLAQIEDELNAERDRIFAEEFFMM